MHTKVKTHKGKFKFKIGGRFRDFMEYADGIADLIPKKEDGPFKSTLKVLAIVDRLLDVFEEETNPYQEFVKLNNLKEKKDSTFIDLFFGTPVKGMFQEEILFLGDEDRPGYVMHEYYSDKFGTLYFMASTVPRPNNDNEVSLYKSVEEASTFYYQEGFEFDNILKELWTIFNNRINISGYTNCNSLKYSKIPTMKDPFTGGALQWVKKLGDKHLKYKKDKVPRAELFVGPPGVGKSTLVQKLADSIGDRIMRMEANSMATLSPPNLQFIIGSLSPEVIIVDDVDRAVGGGADSTMFTVLDWMKAEYPGVPLLMTANRVSHLDSAFMRPGRVDEVYWFNLPKDNDRKILLETYMEYFGSSCGEDEKDKIVDVTKDLAVPWIKEIALQLKYQNFESVIRLIDSMKKLKGNLHYSYGNKSEEEYQDVGY